MDGFVEGFGEKESFSVGGLVGIWVGIVKEVFKSFFIAIGIVEGTDS